MAASSGINLKKRRFWTDLAMSQAYNAVLESRLTISGAARQFGIPRMTLSDRVRGKIDVHAKLGNQPALTATEEGTIEKYILYMHQQRFPVTRHQVMGLAWAVDMKKESPAFNVTTGPSLKWWRGFKSRHPNLTLRTAEAVDRGRVENANPDVFNDYFTQLGEIIDEKKLQPDQIYNCDEAAIFLNKNSQKVIVPRNSRHAHTRAHGTSEHISVLCTIRADGGFVAPLIVFSRGLPTLRGFQDSGPAGASYATTESGFVSKELYISWFEKTFLTSLPPKRPVLLIQDSATAHVSGDLIQLAIQNQIILLCLPAKLTHALQPCDVSVFKKMKSETSKIMAQLRMCRGDSWVSKSRFPAIFKGIFENTMLPRTITEAFRKCGIVPLNPDAVDKDFKRSGEIPGQDISDDNTENEPPCPTKGALTTTTVLPDDGIEVQLEVIEDMPGNAEVIELNSGMGDTKPCPPALALHAIEATLTPKKKKAYNQKYSAGVTKCDDLVYSTWKILKSSVQPKEENVLVKAGIIPPNLAEIFPSPLDGKKNQQRFKYKRACVLTSTEISSRVAEQERLKREKQDKKMKRQVLREKKKKEKEEAKSSREKERKRKKMAKESTVKASKKSLAHRTPLFAMQEEGIPEVANERQRYFHQIQGTLSACSSFEAMVRVSPEQLLYPLNLEPASIPDHCKLDGDIVAQQLLCNSVETAHFQSIAIIGDGNCLPRAVSKFMVGDESMHVEFRIRMSIELIKHSDFYLCDKNLAHGLDTGKKRDGLAARYASYSGHYNMHIQNKLTAHEVRKIFEDEVMGVVRDGTFCGIWQLHAFASVLRRPLCSVYPGMGPPKKDLDRLILPRGGTPRDNSLQPIVILWSSTRNADVKSWWNPNHFVLAVEPQRHPGNSKVYCQ